tara:strand:+ start:6582 stop:7490 length:909 start_codon:yes stop_codon:yes gene_type:complete
MKNIQILKNSPFPAREKTSAGQTKGALFFKSLKKLCKNPLSASGVVIVGLLLVLAIAAPMIATHDPLQQDLARVLSAPSWAHWFGTDEYGRDIFSRVVHGSRVTLYIIFLVTIIVGPIGLAIGTMSGYFGGWVDSTFMRITDIFISFPSLVLALAFVAALGPGLEHAVIAIALTSWPPVARLARAETLTFRNSDYVVVAQLQGASSFRILFHYISVMCLPSLIVRLTMNMATVILTAAALGFLGLGAQPPLPEWGAMISTGRSYMLESWWLVAFPGAAIMLVSLAFNLLGDGLRDLLDPRTE